MIRRFGTQVASLAILAPALLSGCASKPDVSASAASAEPVSTAQPARKLFTLDTPVDRIAADPQGKAVLDRDVPGLMASKDFPLFDDMSLTQIALLSGGRLTKSKLDRVKSDLIQISYLTSEPAPAVIAQEQ